MSGGRDCTSKVSKIAGSTVVAFRVQVGLTLQVTPQMTPQVTSQVVALLEVIRHLHWREELQRVIGLRDQMHFQKVYLEPLLAEG
jgi:hypothetical protein